MASKLAKAAHPTAGVANPADQRGGVKMIQPTEHGLPAKAGTVHREHVRAFWAEVLEHEGLATAYNRGRARNAMALTADGDVGHARRAMAGSRRHLETRAAAGVLTMTVKPNGQVVAGVAVRLSLPVFAIGT